MIEMTDDANVTAEFMAWLNPSTCRFSVGRGGGRPELDPQVVAGALAFTTPGLGRELLCRIYWPDGSRQAAEALDRLMLDAQLDEWSARESGMYRALAWVATETSKDNKAAATRSYSSANLRRWPRWVVKAEPLELAETYADIRRVVIEELSSPRACASCDGKGQALAHGKPAACARCGGAGILRFGPTWRAKRLGMKESSFAQTWLSPYEWMYVLARDRVGAAQTEFLNALRR